MGGVGKVAKVRLHEEVTFEQRLMKGETEARNGWGKGHSSRATGSVKAGREGKQDSGVQFWDTRE